MRIAIAAGESEVSAVVSSAMLASDDVLDVIGEEWLRLLAAGSSIRSDNRLVHGRFAGAARPSGGMTFSQEPTSFRLQNGAESLHHLIEIERWHCSMRGLSSHSLLI